MPLFLFFSLSFSFSLSSLHPTSSDSARARLPAAWSPRRASLPRPRPRRAAAGSEGAALKVLAGICYMLIILKKRTVCMYWDVLGIHPKNTSQGFSPSIQGVWEPVALDSSSSQVLGSGSCQIRRKAMARLNSNPHENRSECLLRPKRTSPKKHMSHRFTMVYGMQW